MAKVNLSLKIPEETHQRLKIYAIVSGKSMSQLIVDFVESLEIEVPSLKGEAEESVKVPMP